MQRLVLAIVVTWIAASAWASGPPAPTATDSFAHDAWMRRNAHPLTVKLIACGKTGGTDVPVTMAIGCGENDYAVGGLCPVIDGKPIPAQVDVLATWPGDGSIKHAMVSMIVPKIGAGGKLVVTFTKAAPPAPPAFQLAAPVKDLAVRAEFVAADGAKVVSAVPPAAMAKIADVLAGKAAPGAVAPRLAGPVCYEFEVHDVPVAAGKADADLDVFYRLRFYTGSEGVRIAWVVENTRVPAKPYPDRFPIADRDFAGVSFQAGAGGQVAELARLPKTTHWYGTRYRVLRWLGDEPVKVYPKQSVPYLSYAQFFPKLDASHPLTDAEVAMALKMFRNFRAGYDPAAGPLGEVLSHGIIGRNMLRGGGRPDIGAYATWHRLALASEAPELHQMALAADGNGLGAFPVHRRQQGTLAPGMPWDHPLMPAYFYTFNANQRRQIDYKRSANRCPHTPDYAHTPSGSFYSYLTTGEKFFEEQLAFWGMYPSYWLIKGRVPTPTRATAWQLRNVTDAAFLLPGDHPRKKYLTDFVARNVKLLAADCDKRGHLLIGPGRKCSGRKHFVCSAQASLWQYTWLIWSLDNTARKGFPAAAGVRDKAAELLLRIYEGKEEYTGPDGKIYRYKAEDAFPYSTAIDMIQVAFNDDGTEKDTFLRDITDNTGAMYYYTMINTANCYSLYDAKSRIEYNKWKKTLPRKVMRPEDWPLPARMARRGPGEAWHEMSNAECSAALARYNNPRARKMYEMVRKIMDSNTEVRGHLPDTRKRIRGIEYVR